MPLNRSQTYLRWAGGKHRVVPRLRRFVPRDYQSRVYHEPFLGAASLFLSLGPKRAHLSDMNEDLIRSFQYVRERPHLVARYLSEHAARDSEAYYYFIRGQYNSATAFSCAQAARFIYLNRTCFNGIFRVNRQGAFNVPYGKLRKPLFPDRDHLEQVSWALGSATLRAIPYQESLDEVDGGSFVYLDPPYPPLNGTSFFRHYTPDLFALEDQMELASLARRLIRRGCLVMVSNADTPVIRDLYDGLFITALRVRRYVSCKLVKNAVSELVITNYAEEEMLEPTKST